VKEGGFHFAKGMNRVNKMGGRILFEKNCVLCHGSGGRGNGPAALGLGGKPADLVESRRHEEGGIASKIADDSGSMPAWKEKLSENDIRDLTNFLQSLGNQAHQ